MSYPNLPPQRPYRRPSAVGVAAVLLVVLAAGGLTYATAGLVALNGIVERFRTAATGRGVDPGRVDSMTVLPRGLTAAAAILAVAVAVLLVVLALGLLRGVATSRTASLALCTVGLLCGCGTVAAALVQRAVPFTVDDRGTAALLASLGEAYPRWWLPLNMTLSVGQVLGYLVVALLLMLPSVAGWFRRPVPSAQPPAASHPPVAPTR